jgi:hypothetical protein
VAPHARRTTRLREVVRLVAVALGGEAGARLIDRLGMPTSPATLRRAIRHATRPTKADPRVMGSDDFALRHGQRYGTVIVDREHGTPADLLPDRSAPTVASWLAAHPGVAGITRDRAPEYARGIAAGAAQASEVLDRWHVHKNVREALERFLSRHQHTLGALPLPEVAGTEADDVASGEPPPRSRGERAARQAKRERRVARYEAVRDLHAQGVSRREIGRRLGLSRWAVRHDMDAHAFPDRQRHRHHRRARRRGSAHRAWKMAPLVWPREGTGLIYG